MRGLEIACRPSVTLVDCDHISWKSWKLIARSISPTPSNALSNGTIPDPLRPPLPQNLGFAIATENFNLKFRANDC